MEPEIKPRPVRIVSGSPEEIDYQLGTVLKNYQIIQFNFAVVKDVLKLTVIAVHESEIRKMQLMQMPQGRPI
jgi:hypothetical protein